MSAEAVRVEFAPGVQRCPFCHESVAVDATDWVACKQCLARHHAACWGESKRCASCKCEVSIGDAGLPAPRGREAELDAPPPALWTAATALVGLGLPPMVSLESRFAAHCGRNVDELPASAAAAREAVGPSPIIGRMRWALPAVVIALAAAFTVLFAPPHLPRAVVAGVLLAAAVGCAFFHLNLFRIAVRWHESQQFLAQLLCHEAPQELASELLRRLARRWSLRRGIDLALMLVALASLFGPLVGLAWTPALAIASIPLAALRARGALAMHLRHERELADLLKPQEDKPA